ncbi:hypothetical protein GPECTOR_5g27 [Gonium pectorale]|uniref:Uncharacterized protein n=1 Tax=Gonium pectorale TaxID=33097 RepID=A0A150GWM8_GONPE|nr:hypothetical protein GPECTOR_5g27 [Gonium pectorale]|eukprot:KXZ54173.1 hypothetical protein GPECTOR_5g27 [Gonium pectorale]
MLFGRAPPDATLLLVRARDEKLDSLRRSLADSDFEVHQLRIALECTAFYSARLEADRCLADGVVSRVCAELERLARVADAVADAVAVAAAASDASDAPHAHPSPFKSRGWPGVQLRDAGLMPDRRGGGGGDCPGLLTGPDDQPADTGSDACGGDGGGGGSRGGDHHRPQQRHPSPPCASCGAHSSPTTAAHSESPASSPAAAAAAAAAAEGLARVRDDACSLPGRLRLLHREVRRLLSGAPRGAVAAADWSGLGTEDAGGFRGSEDGGSASSGNEDEDGREGLCRSPPRPPATPPWGTQKPLRVPPPPSDVMDASAASGMSTVSAAAAILGQACGGRSGGDGNGPAAAAPAARGASYSSSVGPSEFRVGSAASSSSSDVMLPPPPPQLSLPPLPLPLPPSAPGPAARVAAAAGASRPIPGDPIPVWTGAPCCAAGAACGGAGGGGGRCAAGTGGCSAAAALASARALVADGPLGAGFCAAGGSGPLCALSPSASPRAGLSVTLPPTPTPAGLGLRETLQGWASDGRHRGAAAVVQGRPMVGSGLTPASPEPPRRPLPPAGGEPSAPAVPRLLLDSTHAAIGCVGVDSPLALRCTLAGGTATCAAAAAAITAETLVVDAAADGDPCPAAAAAAAAGTAGEAQAPSCSPRGSGPPHPAAGCDAAELALLRLSNEALRRQVAELQRQNDLMQLQQLGGHAGQRSAGHSEGGGHAEPAPRGVCAEAAAPPPAPKCGPLRVHPEPPAPAPCSSAAPATAATAPPPPPPPPGVDPALWELELLVASSKGG